MYTATFLLEAYDAVKRACEVLIFAGVPDDARDDMSLRLIGLREERERLTDALVRRGLLIACEDHGMSRVAPRTGRCNLCAAVEAGRQFRAAREAGEGLTSEV